MFLDRPDFSLALVPTSNRNSPPPHRQVKVWDYISRQAIEKGVAGGGQTQFPLARIFASSRRSTFQQPTSFLCSC